MSRPSLQNLRSHISIINTEQLLLRYKRQPKCTW